jgi:aminopeptidase YwaD
MRFIWGFLVLVFCGSVSGSAQDSSRFQKSINTLASPQFSGRGYLKMGHLKAANFIEKNFKKAGLIPFGKGFKQDVAFPQNLFTAEPLVKVNGRRLRAGLDFLPAPSCPPVNGNFKLVFLDSAGIVERGRNEIRNFPSEAWVLAVNPSFRRKVQSQFSPGLWIIQESKLTHSLSQDQNKAPSLVLRNNHFLPTDTVIEVNLKAVVREVNSQNVIGMIRGAERSDSFLVVCAHYDHLGMLGKKIYFPGANDNASGTAFLLELAHWYARHPPKYNLIFIAFTGEEAGLLGSSFFVQNPLFPLSKIKFLVNLDLLGFGEKGATVVNATLHPEAFDRLKFINETKKYLPEIKSRGKAANSDHYPFSEVGVPAFFLYTLGGPGFYHDVFDRPETINLKHFSSNFGLIRDFLDSF